VSKPNIIAVATVALTLTATTFVTAAQEESDEVADFTQTTCAELAAVSEADRAFSLIFYYGFMAGRSGATTIDNGAVSGHLDAVREYCTANPDSLVVDAFIAALK
jgi:hypothetical protein